MGKLFILIKRRGSKRFLGVIPAKGSATSTTLKRQLRTQIKKGFTFKIVSLSTLKKVITRQRPKSIKIKRSKRRMKSKKRSRRRRKR